MSCAVAPPATAPWPFVVVDAFASRPFTGNPAAVVRLPPLPAAPGDGVLQAVAAEFNLSETAFLTPRPAAGRFGLRWFTPTREVPLCGHATLAAAHALLAEAAALALPLPGGPRTVVFETLSGDLEVAAEEATGLLRMRFPVNTAERAEEAFDLGAADSAGRATVLRSLVAAALEGLGPPSGAVPPQDPRVHSMHYSRGTGKLIVRLQDAGGGGLLRALTPDSPRLLAVDQTSLGALRVSGVAVTVLGGGEDADADEGQAPDFLSRYFSPWNGIAEDPVNGSSHTALCPYWAGVLGRPRVVGRMASRRGGTLVCTLAEGRVEIAGRCVTVAAGALRAAAAWAS